MQSAAELDITLVNPRPAFVERIRLHQLITGTSTGTQDYGHVLGAEVRLVVDAARRIDALARRIHLRSGAALDYDYLIYAVGSTGAVPEGAPGAAEFAYPLAELEQAQRLRDRMDEVPPAEPVVVVGGGLTGIESSRRVRRGGPGRHPGRRRAGAVAGTPRGAARWPGGWRRLGVTVVSTRGRLGDRRCA